MAAPPDPLPAWHGNRRDDAEDDLADFSNELRAVYGENARLAAELERAQADSLSQRIQRDDFLSYVAHELRTPLTLILGYSQAIARRMHDRPECARDLGDLERVIASTRRLSGMVDEMLDVSRVETGRLRLSIRTFSLRSAAQEAVNRAPHGRLVQLVGAGSLPEALGDAARVGHALWILVRNALIVTPSDHTVRIALGASHLFVSATVEDQGPAVPDGEIPGLFDLSSVYPVAADKREGLGLGLFVARGIARSLGGDVRYERPEGGASVGNCLVLTIPRASPEPLPFSSE